jgi:RNA polymerase sigma factor (sigma-70 family)
MTSDEQILKLLRQGRDDKALGELYRHLPGIRRMIRFYGGRRDEAEDIFQESLIIFCRKARDPEFRLGSGSYAYLYSVSRLLWSEELRRQRRRPLAGLDELDPVDSDAQEAVSAELRYELAERIVDGLADRCRDLLQLFYTGRLKLKDIALKMGYSSEQSAKSQKYKCLEAARQQYRQALQSDNLF